MTDLTDSLTNSIYNVANGYQGAYRRVLCVCSAGLLRSPTAAMVLSQKPYNYNTRACGTEPEYALINLSAPLIVWADEIVCMSPKHKEKVLSMMEKINPGRDYSKPIQVLDIPDNFEYRHPKLIKLIKQKYVVDKVD